MSFILTLAMATRNKKITIFMMLQWSRTDQNLNDLRIWIFIFNSLSDNDIRMAIINSDGNSAAVQIGHDTFHPRHHYVQTQNIRRILFLI